MKYLHVIGFGIILAAITGTAITLNMPKNLIYAIVGLPATLVGIFALTKIPAFIPAGKSDSEISRNGGTGNGFDDVAIRPAESWDFVNTRIDELDEQGIIHPYRKIDTDTTNIRHNRDVSQERVFFKIDGRRTVGVILTARPREQAKFKEKLYYLVDLKKPQIADYKGDLKTSDARDNPFKDKYEFYHERGGDSEPQQQGSKNEFYFDSPGPQEEGA